MFEIDKTMYEELYDWLNRNRRSSGNNGIAEPQIMYVKSHDRTLTDVTLRKLILEVEREEFNPGDLFVSLYSFKNFQHNMRDYFIHICELYSRALAEDAAMEEIIDAIEAIPLLGGWIMLIMEDFGRLSGNPEQISEILHSIMTLGRKRACIILVGDRECKDFFSGSGYTLCDVPGGYTIAGTVECPLIKCYEQDLIPHREVFTAKSSEDRLGEMVFYWDTIYDTLEHEFFDYEYFKILFKETLEYLLPRVEKCRVYRVDVWLIEKLGKMRGKRPNRIDGCKPWEFAAAKKLTAGLHDAITDRWDHGNEFLGKSIEIDLYIGLPEDDLDVWATGNYNALFCIIGSDNACNKMDKVAALIYECSHNGGMNGEKAQELEDEICDE